VPEQFQHPIRKSKEMQQPLVLPMDSDFRTTKILPHIGNDYGKSTPWGLPILLLGESHYGADAGASPRQFTRIVLKEVLDGVNYPFFTKAVGVFDGRWPDMNARRRFWRTSVFCNFIQESVGHGPRIRPTSKMWKSAGAALEETLMLCMPGFVLVLGSEVWNNLPIPLRDGPTIECGTQTKRSRLYFNDNGYALAFGIDHPSCFGWSYSKWTPWVKAALKESIKFQSS
jgi:hypothetical protein